MSKTCLITGANRGIGRGLVEVYLAQPNHTIVAAVRDPSHTTAQSLKQLPKAKGSSLIIVKIRSDSDTDAAEAVKELQNVHGIKSLDLVIANAGLSGDCPRIEDARVTTMQEYYNVNVIGVIVLFKAVLPLLKECATMPKLIAMGSAAGSIGGMEDAPIPNANYGPVKAGLNWVMRKIHMEHEEFIAFPIHPGFTQTETANAAARSFGMEEAPVPFDESLAGLAKVVRRTIMAFSPPKIEADDALNRLESLRENLRAENSHVMTAHFLSGSQLRLEAIDDRKIQESLIEASSWMGLRKVDYSYRGQSPKWVLF